MVKKPREADVIDSVGGFKFMSELIKFYGPVHAARFFGWCVLIGASLRERETSARAVERLTKLGFSRSGAYKAIGEIQEFKQHLVDNHAEIYGAKLRIEDMLTEIRNEGMSLSMDENP